MMTYKSTITVEITENEQKEKLLKLFAPEEKQFERSEFVVKTVEEGILFEVKSKDPTALRATLNTITQCLTIQYKIQKNNTRD
jgi:tRNA threonylcarbamoyladenosine modification (KEOPS) complex  Pcc1 subunit